MTPPRSTPAPGRRLPALRTLLVLAIVVSTGIGLARLSSCRPAIPLVGGVGDATGRTVFVLAELDRQGLPASRRVVVTRSAARLDASRRTLRFDASGRRVLLPADVALLLVADDGTVARVDDIPTVGLHRAIAALGARAPRSLVDWVDQDDVRRILPDLAPRLRAFWDPPDPQ